MIAILPTLANWPRKKHWNAGSWIFYVIHTNPCFHTIGLCWAHFLSTLFHKVELIALMITQLQLHSFSISHIHSQALNLHSSFSFMIISTSIEFFQQKKRLRKNLDFFLM
jgi:hypothetical protein